MAKMDYYILAYIQNKTDLKYTHSYTNITNFLFFGKWDNESGSNVD